MPPSISVGSAPINKDSLNAYAEIQNAPEVFPRGLVLVGESWPRQGERNYLHAQHLDGIDADYRVGETPPSWAVR
jgi:hypothetical protein